MIHNNIKSEIYRYLFNEIDKLKERIIREFVLQQLEIEDIFPDLTPDVKEFLASMLIPLDFNVETLVKEIKNAKS